MEKNLRARKALGAENASLPVPRRFNNGNEARYPSKIGSDTRGLPHDAHGEVDLNAWGTLLRALDTQDPPTSRTWCSAALASWCNRSRLPPATHHDHRQCPLD